MPHIIVEYTDNIRADARVPALLKTINDVLIAQDGVFPIGGIRSRALALTDYRMADGEEDYAFVHITLKIGAGRPEAARKAACDALFEAVKAHFAELYARRYLALSMELVEFNEGGSYKHNNVHARFKKA
ncbi:MULTISPECIES: 5-carboxymethyl-2-hydroxymuconate Delta-isomerase [Cupriavidus]|uniref:5-carboxymethyl-2-hydroxymuconate delta-isomerase n=1 Tax=Cupriavidus basilensis TaxID=68895 RepID=A0A0C4YBU9_9BURK|nr:5-carboxymethyl-2-hydroxymuconate Delta-isomerase [Cupriavidus basilensis]AJG23057.1 5-carboxymethyl-2-hydroxymuconate delta-isomerase [Cupriavidus basilensis]